MRYRVKVCIGHAGGSTATFSKLANNWEHAANIWNGLNVKSHEWLYLTIDGTHGLTTDRGEHFRVTADYLMKNALGLGMPVTMLDEIRAKSPTMDFEEGKGKP